jgi:hypothetical protein
MGEVSERNEHFSAAQPGQMPSCKALSLRPKPLKGNKEQRVSRCQTLQLLRRQRRNRKAGHENRLS